MECSKNLIFFYFLITLKNVFGGTQPNIIFIMSDDQGYADRGLNGLNEFSTPNLDGFGAHSVILPNYYSEPICTPSRAAFMTGKIPSHTGMQHYVLQSGEPRGLPLSETLLPQYLKSLNYSNYLVGKWNLGHWKKEYTPIYRGFDKHLGIWTGHHDYFDHFAFESEINPFYGEPNASSFNSGTQKGLDMRRGLEAARDLQGQYSTDVFTDEAINILATHNKSKPFFLFLSHVAVHCGNDYNQFPAPEELVAEFAHITPWQRRRYAAMVTKLDESVGKVLEAAANYGHLDNAVVVFVPDNGPPAQTAMDQNYGSSYPLRGSKYTLFEGGCRVGGNFWSSSVKNPGRVSENLVHVTDWVPTLIRAAGGDPSKLKGIDGKDQWDSLNNDGSPVRKEIVHLIDGDMGAIRIGDWKYITGANTITAQLGGYVQYREEKLAASYNTSAVLSSPAFKALSKITKSSATAEKLHQLREGLIIHCNNTNESDQTRNSAINCNPSIRPCLFNLKHDPCESTDLSDKYPFIAQMMRIALTKANSTYVPPGNLPNDPKGNPKYWNYEWTNFGDGKADL